MTFYNQSGPFVVVKVEAQTANDGFVFLRAELAAATAENERYRGALEDIALNTSTSVPLGLYPEDFHAHNSRRAIRIADDALSPEPAP